MHAYEDLARSSVSTEINPSQSEAQQVEKNCYTGVSSGALSREARSGAPWIKKCGKLPIRENLVIT